MIRSGDRGLEGDLGSAVLVSSGIMGVWASHVRSPNDRSMWEDVGVGHGGVVLLERRRKRKWSAELG